MVLQVLTFVSKNFCRFWPILAKYQPPQMHEVLVALCKWKYLLWSCLVWFKWHLVHASTLIVNICTAAFRLWYSEKMKMKMKVVWLLREERDTNLRMDHQDKNTTKVNPDNSFTDTSWKVEKIFQNLSTYAHVLYCKSNLKPSSIQFPGVGCTITQEKAWGIVEARESDAR